MAKSILTKSFQWPAALIAGWLIPGAGHWLLGRRLRAVIIFVTIHLMFISGLAIGGVFTINPRVERLWQYAQLGTGSAAIVCHKRQDSLFKQYMIKAQSTVGPFKPSYPSYKNSPEKKKRLQYAREYKSWVILIHERANALVAADKLALVEPAKSSAIIYSAIAGLMNIICAIDACLLCMMGSFGEPAKGETPPEVQQ